MIYYCQYNVICSIAFLMPIPFSRYLCREFLLMFNRYWRDYPWVFQFIQFIVLILVFASFFIAVIIPVLAHFTGVPVNAVSVVTEHSSRRLIDAALLYQFVASFGIFLVPAFLFGYFTHPRPFEFLGLRPAGKSIQWLIVAVLMTSAIPLLIQINTWFSVIKLSGSFKEMQDENERAVQGLMNMTVFMDFLKSFVTLAILPAVGEELFFRGVMFRMAAKKNRNIMTSIILTALVFALFHFNVYGFISILFAGTILGYVYYLTGSLWLSILAHLINNGLQIIVVYLLRDSQMAKMVNEQSSLPWYIPAVALVIFAASCYLLWKNRTPLPADWPSDFSPEELNEANSNNFNPGNNQ